MPTQDQLLFIQSIKDLAANIRGGGQAAAEGQIRRQDIDLKQQNIQDQRGFLSEQAQAAQRFAASQQTERLGQQQSQFEKRLSQEDTLERERLLSQEHQARIKAAGESGGASSGVQKIAEEVINSIGTSGVNPSTGQPELTKDDLVKLGGSSGQAKLVRDQMITMMSLTDDEFNPADVIAVNRKLKEELQRAGVDPTQILKFLNIGKSTTRAQYITQLGRLHEGLLSRNAKEITKAQKLLPESVRSTLDPLDASAQELGGKTPDFTEFKPSKKKK